MAGIFKPLLKDMLKEEGVLGSANCIVSKPGNF